MPELVNARPRWRVTLLLSLACALATPVASLSVPGTGQDQQQQSGERQRDPEEPADGGERTENADEATATGAATLLLTPSRFEIAAGSTLHLSLSVLGANDLRRLPVTVRFDPDVLEFVSVGLGSGWDEGPQPVLMHDSSRPGEIVIGLGLLDKKLAGLNGSVELLEFEFLAVGRGDAGLRLENFAAIAGGARAQPTSAAGTEIVVR